ncbi:hypothetical protein [Flavobacterium sp. LAR06]|uniref:hypothetical protein n=1 Tax=Flavobacterium sp. LAR06 TaxID=3064897 RepID=UPI0035BFD25F
MKLNKKVFFCLAFMLTSLHAFPQFIVINITVINTDKGLLRILTEKSAVNSAILANQTLIYTGLKDIKDSKIETRIREYERNKHDRSLQVPIASNLLLNNLLMGAAITTRPLLPFYNTAAKNEYFIRELAINDAIAFQIALTRNGNIRNANTQELYSLDQKMLSKLKKTNENGQRNAVFIILTSLLAKTATLSESDLNKILSLGL